MFLGFFPMAKAIRIIILLLILATVAQETWLARSRATAWQNTLYVGIYPIAGDASANTQRYVGALNADSFRAIDAFFEEEAKRYGLSVWRPLSIAVAPPVVAMPPAAPRDAICFSRFPGACRCAGGHGEMTASTARSPPCASSCCITIRKLIRALRIRSAWSADWSA